MMIMGTPVHGKGTSSRIQMVSTLASSGSSVAATALSLEYVVDMASESAVLPPSPRLRHPTLAHMTAVCCCFFADSNHSQQGGSDQQQAHKRGDGKHSDSRDSGMAAGQELALLHDLDPVQLLHECRDPIHAASMYAAHKAKQQAAQQPGPPGGSLGYLLCSSCVSQALFTAGTGHGSQLVLTSLQHQALEPTF